MKKKSTIPVLKISPVLIEADGVILSRSPDIRNIKDLKGQSIGIVRGWLWMTELTRRHARVVKASNILDLGHLFNERRVDAILAVEKIVPFLGVKGYVSQKIIDLRGYVFLKKTSKDHAGEVSKALNDYVKSGNSFFDAMRALNSFSSNS